MSSQVALKNTQSRPIMTVTYNGLRTYGVRYNEDMNLLKVTDSATSTKPCDIYTNLFEKIDGHLVNHSALKIQFRYEHFSTSSLKYLFKLVKKLNHASLTGKAIAVYWTCNASITDSEIFETGVDMMELSQFKFVLSYL